MFPTDFQTWIIYILLALVLGALGNGLWEGVFKPFFTWTTRVFLQVSTFGFTAARDSIYKEIARRILNKPVLFILFLLSVVLSSISGWAWKQYSLSNISEEVALKLEQDKEKWKEELAKLSKEEIKKKIADLDSKIRESDRQMASIELLLAIFFFIASAYAFARNTYISSAISHFDQCLAICRPYISQERRTELLAQFASMSSKSDYEKLISSIIKIAETNELKLPLFIVL